MSSNRRPNTADAIVYFARFRIGEIRNWTGTSSKEAFVADTMLRVTVERNFIAIGEALRDLSRRIDLAALDPKGPWREPVAFRDFLAHVYAWEIDGYEVWATTQLDLEVLDAALARIEPLVGGPFDPDRELT